MIKLGQSGHQYLIVKIWADDFAYDLEDLR